MRENRNRGPKLKLRSQIFVSQSLCCAIPVPYMLPPFLMLFAPPALLTLAWGTGTCSLFLVFFTSLIPALVSSAALLCRRCKQWRRSGFNPNLRHLGVWDASQLCPVLGAPRKHRLGLNWISYLFQIQEGSHDVLIGHRWSRLWDPFLERMQLPDNKPIKR